MENHACNLSPTKHRRQIQQTEKKIASLEIQCHRSKQQEKLYYDEILVYHKRAAKLDQHLLLANRKNGKLLVLIQDTEKQNKSLKRDYLEACKKISELEVRNRCMTNRESYFENQVEFGNKSLKLMEAENTAALRKVDEFQQSRELIEKKRRETVGQLYEVQTKNAELEATLQFIKRRNCCLCNEKENEVQSKEELMECDRELMTSGSTESRLYVLKREKDTALEQLHFAEREVLESERRNSDLRQQIAELTLTITERDHQIRQCKQLFDATRRNYHDEVCKLEGSVFHWQTKYEQCLMEMEKENVGNEKTDVKDHEACWELKLRACQSDVAERDITIAYLQKLKNAHEDKIRQILSEYQQDICNQKISSHSSTVPDLNNQLQILLSFYKKRSDNATAELGKWKELAVEARLCREKETALFESQLSLISKEYYAKYDTSRESFEKEKSKRVALEGQTHRLVRQLEECESELQSCRKELVDHRELHESLSIENNNNITNVTQQHKASRSACCHQEVVVPMADAGNNQPEGPTEPEQTDELESQTQLKHENIDDERDTENIVEISAPIEGDSDASDKVNEDQAKPVATNNHMETQSNDMVNGSNDNKEVFVDDESLSMEVQNLRAKNNELQALCERLVRERDEQTAGTTVVADQQSNDLASKCESLENEIQKLKQDIEEATVKQSVLENSNSDLKAENQRLENLVQELQARIHVLESVNEATENSNTMTSETPRASAEVVEAKIDSVQDVEDALNESFAAQDLQSPPVEVPDGVKSPGEVVSDEVIMEEPSKSTPEKQPSPHASLSRNKFPSAASTAPMPFKRHSHAGISHRPRLRAGSTEIGTAVLDRRASFGSDTSDTVEEEAKPRFVPKKFSTSHLDAFKPKPFKKQMSLSDDIHLYSRPGLINSGSKVGSTESAGDTESSHEVQHESVHSPAEFVDPFSPSTVTSPKQPPPATLPKPRKPQPEKPASQSELSHQENSSGIHTESETAAEPKQQPVEDTSQGELV